MESDYTYEDSVRLGLERTHDLTSEPLSVTEQWAYLRGREDELRWNSQCLANHLRAVFWITMGLLVTCAAIGVTIGYVLGL